MGASNSARSSTSIRFGAYELNLQAGELRKNGVPIRCQEQPLQVLAALAERPGELVTREELRRRVWPEDTFVDFDHALNTAIKKIRTALNDDADSPRYIETVPRRGYRLIAPVEQEPASSAVPTSPTESVPAARAKHRALLAFAGTAIVLFVILGLTWKFAPWHGDASTTPQFERLTFDLSELGDARFTPDGASVVYSAGWYPHKGNLFTQRVGGSGSQPLGIASTLLLAVSPRAEIAMLSRVSDSRPSIVHEGNLGTLARVPLNGGAPRELLSDVEAADWSLSGDLAVVRRIGDKSRLEYPVGKVLYENTGWIGSPRFSPTGDSIAFLDHPIVADDRGSVAIVDLSGNVRTLSKFWETLRGLAWSPQGDGVWFAATRSGIARALYAVTLAGRERRVLSVAGGLSLRDISREGKVLISRDNERLGISFVGAGDTEPRELSWEDWSMVTDISPDGKRILFGAEGENSGFSYQVGLRPTDGSAPVILGSGGAQSVSPDGKWALSIVPPPNDQIVLLPTGAGSQRILERAPIKTYAYKGAKWLPDSSQIVFVGYEAGHGPQCYVQSVQAGKPRPFTPEGMLFCSVSPTGGIVALTEDFRALLYGSTSGEKPDKEFKFGRGEVPVGWTADSKFLYLVRTEEDPQIIERFEIATGRRSVWKQVMLPSARSGIRSEGVVITPDGQSYAYTYSNHSSELYLVQGLK
jgi:DNA-binding winged helix-turn-helix (wHTH) protein